MKISCLVFFFFLRNSAWFLQCIDIKVKFQQLLPENSLNSVLFFPGHKMKQYAGLKMFQLLEELLIYFLPKEVSPLQSISWFLYLAPLFQYLVFSFGLSPFFSVSKALRSEKEHHVPVDCPGHMLRSCAKFAADQLACIARRLIFKIYNRFFWCLPDRPIHCETSLISLTLRAPSSSQWSQSVSFQPL